MKPCKSLRKRRWSRMTNSTSIHPSSHSFIQLRNPSCITALIRVVRVSRAQTCCIRGGYKNAQRRTSHTYKQSGIAWYYIAHAVGGSERNLRKTNTDETRGKQTCSLSALRRLSLGAGFDFRAELLHTKPSRGDTKESASASAASIFGGHLGEKTNKSCTVAPHAESVQPCNHPAGCVSVLTCVLNQAELG